MEIDINGSPGGNEGSKELSSALEVTPKEGRKGHPGKRGWSTFVNIPPRSSAHRVVRRPRAQEIRLYSTATNPLAIVLEGYPEQTVTSEQLTLLQGALVSEVTGIREGLLPRFTRTAALRNNAVVIKDEDEVVLSWLTENRAHLSIRRC
ncbi:phosphoenolpyruvate carboxylase [Lasius niger]|uniref:Phosphoenolpyruvate carboxylase n=1 Tax=Lasius niger TaxID=67767 RepID=A0A0J7KTK9_LASNI|nr:phosphoenolpyruvate carboxylase [Lasius niger]